MNDYPDPVDPDEAISGDMTGIGNPPPPPPASGLAGAQLPPTAEGLSVKTINWRTLPASDAPAVWMELRSFVEWFTTRYNTPVSTVPICWWKHPTLVEELSALATAHAASFDPKDSGFGPIGWHERLTIAIPRLTRAYAGGCSRGHEPTKPRNWDGATDESEWTTWTSQAHAHGDTPGASPRKEEER